MPFVKVENGVVVQKSFKPREGFVPAPDFVTCGYEDAGGGVFVAPPPSAEVVENAARIEQELQDRQDAKEDAKLQEIAALRPAQAKQWAKDNFPTLTNSEQRALGAIVTAIAVLGRTL